MKKHLINTLLISGIAAGFTACSTQNQAIIPNDNNKSITNSKNNIDTSSSNILPYTKEGLDYYNKRYEQMLLSNNIEEVHNYTKVLVDNFDYFLNYDLKINNLFKKIPNNKTEYLLTKANYYSKSYQSNKNYALLNENIKKLSEKDLNQLINTKKQSFYILNKRNMALIEEAIKENSYKTPALFHYNKLSSYKYAKAQRDANLKDFLNNNNNKETIIEVAKIAANKRYYRLATQLYKKAIELGAKDKEAYFYVGNEEKRYYYDKKKKAQALEYLKKASDLGHKEASATILELYAKDKTKLDEYIKLKEKISSDDEALLDYADVLLKNYKYDEANKILEDLVKKGNKEALIKLALSKKSSRYNAEEALRAKEYKNKILNSKDQVLIDKYYTKMKDYKYRYKFKDELEEYSMQKAKAGNLKEIRYIIKNTRLPKEEKGKWLIKAYKLGDNKAAHELARDYSYKYGFFEMDIDKSNKIYNELASKNDIKALNSLGRKYSYGKDKDLEKSVYWYEKSAALGDYTATKYLARYYTCGPCNDYKETDYKKALKYVQTLADQNDSSNMANLAWFYHMGHAGLKKDYKKAAYWYEKAAEYKSTTAMRNLGLMYKEGGDNFPQDYKKAVYWFEKADNSFSHKTANDLGIMYKNGWGVKKDIKKAISYYEKAAKRNNAYAFNNLADLYVDGTGFKKDYKKAKDLYEKAISRGHIGAANGLGILYYQGWGVKKDYKKAKELFLKAQNSKPAEANYNLGLLYENGLGVKKDIPKAISYYKKSTLETAKDKVKKLMK